MKSALGLLYHPYLHVEVQDPRRAQDGVEVPHDERVARVGLLVGDAPPPGAVFDPGDAPHDGAGRLPVVVVAAAPPVLVEGDAEEALELDVVGVVEHGAEDELLGAVPAQEEALHGAERRREVDGAGVRRRAAEEEEGDAVVGERGAVRLVEAADQAASEVPHGDVRRPEAVGLQPHAAVQRRRRGIIAAHHHGHGSRYRRGARRPKCRERSPGRSRIRARPTHARRTRTSCDS